jgi:hypothetical protein
MKEFLKTCAALGVAGLILLIPVIYAALFIAAVWVVVHFVSKWW